jgi:hypothetical protein
MSHLEVFMSGSEMRINGVRGERGGEQARADSAALPPNTAPDSAAGSAGRRTLPYIVRRRADELVRVVGRKILRNADRFVYDYERANVF